MSEKIFEAIQEWDENKKNLQASNLFECFLSDKDISKSELVDLVIRLDDEKNTLRLALMQIAQFSDVGDDYLAVCMMKRLASDAIEESKNKILNQ